MARCTTGGTGAGTEGLAAGLGEAGAVGRGGVAGELGSAGRGAGLGVVPVVRGSPGEP
ncbi:hypothetical protein ACFQ7J_27925 [Streptomyces sp. NPDC056501]|uniref:hypothetical protein n=1 Tax=Streptomyces sp. NPDC056501 TaxID=3345841 RepID=UPI0036B56247